MSGGKPPRQAISPASASPGLAPETLARWPLLRPGHALAPNISVPTAQNPLRSILSTLKAGPGFCAVGTATRTPATRDKLPPPKYPGGVRADSSAPATMLVPARLGLRRTTRTHTAPNISLTSGRPCSALGLTACPDAPKPRPGAPHYLPEVRISRAPAPLDFRPPTAPHPRPRSAIPVKPLHRSVRLRCGRWQRCGHWQPTAG